MHYCPIFTVIIKNLYIIIVLWGTQPHPLTTTQLQRMEVHQTALILCCLLLPLIQVSNGVNLCGSLSSWPVPESPKDTTLKQVISVIRFVNLINYVIIIMCIIMCIIIYIIVYYSWLKMRFIITEPKGNDDKPNIA